MYAKSFRSLLLLVVMALLASACTNYKEPAQQAISQASTALDAIAVDAQKFLPDKYKETQDAIEAAKATFEKSDYKNALAQAKDLPAKVAALGNEVATAKQAAITKWTDEWNSLSADVPNMVSAIQSRVDVLSKSKKLPKNIDQATFDAAKTGLDDMKSTWNAASQSFNSGNVEDAVAKAKQVHDKGTEIMGQLGMKTAAT
jgi:predicted outer membrane protein